MTNLVPKLRLENFLKFNQKIKISNFINNVNQNLIFGELSQSAWSLFLIAIWRGKIFNKKIINIFIPEYFCNTTLTPLRFLEINLVFYKIDHNHEVDKEYFKKLSKKLKPDIILVVDYFGNKQKHNYVREFCINNNSWLVRDSAHNLELRDNCDNFDFVFFSPHKILSYPMQSLLVVNSKGPSSINTREYEFINNSQNWYSQIHKILLDKKAKTKNNLIFSIVWFIKRLSQSLGILIFRKKKKLFSQSKTFSKISDFLDPKIDLFSKFLIKNNHYNIFEEIEIRIRISLAIENLLDNINYKKFGKIKYLNKPNIFKHQLPYFAMIECENAEKLYDYLIDNNIDCISWPDQPHEILNEEFTNAKLFRKNRIFIPLFNLSIIRSITKINKKIFQNNEDYFIEKINNKNEWDIHFREFKINNLLQSWEYGEFKKKYEKYNVFRYLIREKNKKIIGMIQIVNKNFFGINIIRVNRGPLLQSQNLKKSVDIVKKIKKNFLNYKFSPIFFSPEIELNSKNFFYDDNKFFTKGVYSSSKLDLNCHEENILKNFKKEWRKDLKKSQTITDLRIIKVNDESYLQKIIDHYLSEAKIKNFKNINPKLINHLYDKKNLLVFACEYKSNYVGSLCVASHYPGATCLINPISEDYRKFKINHLLIWNSIIELKKLKFEFLDTGGFNFQKTPGPTKFKIGLNASRYNLIGNKIIF